MKTYIAKKLKSKDAQALVEFALCLPLILLIIGMIITIGQMTYCKQVLQAAAEVGCRTYVDSIFDRYDSSFRNDKNAKKLAEEAAKNVIDSAGFGIVCKSAEPIKESNLTDGSDFRIVTYRTTGAIATLFPISWEGKTLVDSDGYTYMYGIMTMLKER